jgi:hypothetical protein
VDAARAARPASDILHHSHVALSCFLIALFVLQHAYGMTPYNKTDRRGIDLRMHGSLLRLQLIVNLLSVPTPDQLT